MRKTSAILLISISASVLMMFQAGAARAETGTSVSNLGSDTLQVQAIQEQRGPGATPNPQPQQPVPPPPPTCQQIGQLLAQFPTQACPAITTATPAPTPAQAANLAWRDQVKLPTPALRIQPGEALAGKMAYLEISGAQNVPWSGVALGIPVTIHAVSTYDVDWGDGSPIEHHADQGGAWPNGDITHVYVNAGHLTVNVSQQWTASWQAGGSAGTIGGVLHTDARFALPVRDVQAFAVN